MPQIAPTKGNLMHARKSLLLAQNGYELMDRKRIILIREMLALVDKVKHLRKEITDAYNTGYFLLQQANVYTGVIDRLIDDIPVENSVQITYRSVMGVEIPRVIYKPPKQINLPYDLEYTNSRIDEAFLQFQKVKEMTMILAEVDNSAYRLARAIAKTEKRANALQNVVIPLYQQQISFISDALDEKEREEFARQKLIKAQKGEAASSPSP